MEDVIGLRSFWLSLSLAVWVVAWSCLGEDLRHGRMNEKGCKGSKESRNGLEKSWK